MSQAYQSFVEAHAEKTAVLDDMQSRADNGRLVSVVSEEMSLLQEAWHEVTNQMKVWKRRLDGNLPGRLGAIASWLDMMEQLLDPSTESMSRDPTQHLQQLKVCVS